MVVQLMKYGADPSLIDGEGCSCIHLAAQFGHTSIVAYLIAKGQVKKSQWWILIRCSSWFKCLISLVLQM